MDISLNDGEKIWIGVIPKCIQRTEENSSNGCRRTFIRFKDSAGRRTFVHAEHAWNRRSTQIDIQQTNTKSSFVKWQSQLTGHGGFALKSKRERSTALMNTSFLTHTALAREDDDDSFDIC